jgi:hypothetical protein
MRTRLTATYSVFTRIMISILIFVGSFILFVNMGFTIWLGRGIPVFAVILLITSYLLLRFILKDRVVIEFDSGDFYIVDASSKTEQKIPLENVSCLNLRPGIIKMTRWYARYSIHYLDNYQQEQKIRLYADWLGKPLKDFVSAVKKKNSSFEFKDYTWTLDFKD